MKKLLIALAMIAGVASAPALTVDSTGSDHCVLQQNMDNYVKGTANANSTVTVKLGGTQIGSGTADSSGNYKVTIRPGAANATSRDLVVSDGSASKTISDVLVGEVWFVAGQSNAFNMMDSAVMSGDYATAYPQWREQFDCPNVRVVISTPTQACGGVSDYYAAAPSQSLNWIVCQKSNESNVKKISPLAFFFGKKLSAYKNCPVGIVLVGQGGTPIGYHMTAECSALAKTYYGGDFNWGDGISSGKNLSACYTRTDTIAARGVIWAQGETDGKISGDKYRHLLRALVENWRSRRNEPNFPFLIYGFANFDDEVEAEGDHKWPRVRWEQEKAVIDGLITPAAVFHAIDLSGSSQKGYAKSIHPDQKPELADRALLAARNLVYGENVAYRCPYPTQAYFNSSKDKVYVTFPSSVSLSMDGSYTHIPFRVKNTKMDGWGASVNPTSVTIGSDGHSLEVAFDTSKLTVNASDLNNSIDYCCVAGTEDTTWIYEQRIKDQNGVPMPPFCLNISNTSSGGDTHVHTWGTPTYTWSADNATCTATATCTGNSSHTASQTVSATLTVVTAATETTDGTGTRTAVFSSPFTTQTKTVTIPATGSGSGSGSGEQPGGQTGDGNANGHEYVQLWADGPAFAKCNVGASSETEFGLMFSYGSTVGTVKGTTTTFDDGCPTAGKTIAQLKSSNIIDANANLSMIYDAANVKMGGDWRMPTKAEIDALVSNCDCVYATVNGVKGTRVTGRGDFASATIFIPTCGYYNAGGTWGNEQFYGIYLTATAEDANMKVYTYILQQNVPFATGTGNRANGYPIRGVLSGASGSGSGSGSGGGDEPGGDTHTHTWGTPSYSWSSDNNSCTATASCTVSGCSQKNTKTVSSTYQVVLTPTETATGTGRYTATFTSPFTTQTKDVTIPKTGSGSSSGSGSAGGHEGVQLWANGPYWATMNCGATASTQSGYYYLNNTDTVGYAVKNGALTGALVRNSSTTLWGDGWRLPTTAEAKLIKDNCNIVSSGTDAAGQPYLVIQGKTSGYTDKTIIFPLGGYGNGGNVSASPNRWGTYGKYWTSDTGVANRLCVGLSSSGGYFEYANGGDVGHGNYYTIRLVRDTMPSGGGNTHTHTWGTPSYTWTETSSGWTCKARVVCTGDSSHVNEQTATATYAVITEATTTSTGLGRYTATFTDAAFATQTKDVTIPKKSDDPGGSGGSGDPTPAYDSADYYVSPTGSDSNNGTSRSTPFATIQKAVSVASSGKKICLLKGTYNVVNPSPYTDSAAIVLDKGVIVFGETGNPADVVVHNTKEWADNSNYNQTYRVFLLNDAGAVLSGVTVENGFVRGGQSEPKFFGGNILISSNGGRVENSHRHTPHCDRRPQYRGRRRGDRLHLGERSHLALRDLEQPRVDGPYALDQEECRRFNHRLVEARYAPSVADRQQHHPSVVVGFYRPFGLRRRSRRELHDR